MGDLAAIGRIAADTGAAPVGDPQAAFGVSDDAVGQALIAVIGDKRPAVARMQVVRGNVVGKGDATGAVVEIERLAIGRNGGAVADGKAGIAQRVTAMRLDAPQGAARLFLELVRGAEPQPAEAVGLGVVVDDGIAALLRIAPGLDAEIGQAQQRYATAVGEGQEIGIAGGGDGADGCFDGERLAFGHTLRQIMAEQGRIEQVDPVEAMFRRVPDDGLAETMARFDEKFNSAHDCVLMKASTAVRRGRGAMAP